MTQIADIVPEMVGVPAGRFLMGSPDDELGRLAVEGPQHWVTIAKPLEVSKFAVTVAEFEAFAAASGNPVSDICQLWDGSAWLQAPGSFRAPGFAQTARHPAVCVSWHDAKNYVAWLRSVTGQPFRLLTEAEWEFAARAGTASAYWWGASVVPEQANFCARTSRADGEPRSVSPMQTVSVDCYARNAWGLSQVHGNVWEWVEDCYVDNYADASCDGSARNGSIASRRVLRGGGWANGPNGVRAARRHAAPPDFRRSDIGFRIASSY